MHGRSSDLFLLQAAFPENVSSGMEKRIDCLQHYVKLTAAGLFGLAPDSLLIASFEKRRQTNASQR